MLPLRIAATSPGEAFLPSQRFTLNIHPSEADNFRVARHPIQTLGQAPGPHFDYRGDVMVYASAILEPASSYSQACDGSSSGSGRMSGFCMITRAQVFHRRMASSFPGIAKFMAFS